MKSLIAAICAAAGVCLFAWFAGFDYDARGSAAFITAWLAFWAAVAAWVWADELK